MQLIPMRVLAGPVNILRHTLLNFDFCQGPSINIKFTFSFHLMCSLCAPPVKYSSSQYSQALAHWRFSSSPGNCWRLLHTSRLYYSLLLLRWRINQQCLHFSRKMYSILLLPFGIPHTHYILAIKRIHRFWMHFIKFHLQIYRAAVQFCPYWMIACAKTDKNFNKICIFIGAGWLPSKRRKKKRSASPPAHFKSRSKRLRATSSSTVGIIFNDRFFHEMHDATNKFSSLEMKKNKLSTTVRKLFWRKMVLALDGFRRI